MQQIKSGNKHAFHNTVSSQVLHITRPILKRLYFSNTQLFHTYFSFSRQILLTAKKIVHGMLRIFTSSDKKLK